MDGIGIDCVKDDPISGSFAALGAYLSPLGLSATSWEVAVKYQR